jgi:hypothetical protein
VGQEEERGRNAPDFDPEEREQVQRANQIFLRLRKELHDREAQFPERDVEEAAQDARWLREIVERHPNGWEQAHEDALAGSDLPEEDEAYLRRGIKEAGGFSPFARRNLQRLEEAAPGERGRTGEPEEVTHDGLMLYVAWRPASWRGAS